MLSRVVMRSSLLSTPTAAQLVRRPLATTAVATPSSSSLVSTILSLSPILSRTRLHRERCHHQQQHQHQQHQRQHRQLLDVRSMLSLSSSSFSTSASATSSPPPPPSPPSSSSTSTSSMTSPSSQPQQQQQAPPPPPPPPKRKARYFLKTLAALAAVYALTLVTNRPGQPRLLRRIRVVYEGVGRVCRALAVGGLIFLDYKYHMLVWRRGSSSDADAVLADTTATDEARAAAAAARDEHEAAWDVVLEQCHQRAADWLVYLATANGGIYVKIGQSIPQLNHVLPSAFCTTLAVLFDQVYARPMSEVRQVFHEELGADIDAFFAEFDTVPMAAASLAQVHRAVTHDGDVVAVKVQYLDLQDRFDGDFHTMLFLMTAATWLFPDFAFAFIVRDAKEILCDELDFRIEVRNAQRARRHLTEQSTSALLRDTVHVPRTLPELCTSRLMTAEFIDGVKITDLDGLARLGVTRKEAMTAAVHTFAFQIFQTGFIHADPHIGNMLVRRRPVTSSSSSSSSQQQQQGPMQLVLLDHGLYIMMDDALRQQFAAFWVATVLRDESAMRRAWRALTRGYRTRSRAASPNRLPATEAAVAVTDNAVATADDDDDDDEDAGADYKLFAQHVFQRPFDTAGVGFSEALTAADTEYMQQGALNHMDTVVGLMQSVHPTLNLLMRNINCVRAINVGTGPGAAPAVNRYVIMGRHAAAGLHVRGRNTGTKDGNAETTVLSTVSTVRQWLWHSIAHVRFEAVLQWQSWRAWCASCMFAALQAVRWAPSNAELGDLATYVTDANA